MTTVIIVAFSILVLFFMQYRVKIADQKRERLLIDAVKGEIDPELLKSPNSERTYAIVYFDPDKSSKALLVKATNDLEAQFLFCRDTGISHFHIKSAYRA